MSLPADLARELDAIERAWSALEVGDGDGGGILDPGDQSRERRHDRRQDVPGRHHGASGAGILGQRHGDGVLREGGQGNPYHDSEGKFTGPGGAGHGSHKHARRRRKLRRLIRAHKRKRRALKSRQHAEKHALIAKQRESVVKHKSYYDRRKASLARDHARDLQKMDAEHGREVGRLERIRAKERVQESGQLQAGKITSEQVTTWEVDHARTVEATKKLNAEIRAQRQEWHAGERENLREERRESFGTLKESQARHRAAMARRHGEERAQLRQESIETIEAHGFKHKGAARGLVLQGADPGVCGEVDPGSVARRLSPGRTHKASSAESILRHALRSLGLTAAYRRGRLTAGQALDVLAEIRDYARGWMHHEFEAFVRHYGRAVDVGAGGSGGVAHPALPARAAAGAGHHHPGVVGGPDGQELRGLSSAMRHHVGRLFGRAKQFVREAILAGAMALSGPGGLTSDDLAEADRAAQDQAAYLDRFEQDVAIRTPPELAAEPSAQALANPMTAKEFAARAEMYGASVWGAAQQMARKRVIRHGGAAMERRVHVGLDTPCQMCRDEVAKGWQSPGVLLPIGACTCLTNCHCHFEVMGRDGKPHWVGGPELPPRGEHPAGPLSEQELDELMSKIGFKATVVVGS